jgi:hypothetical protein
MVNECCRKYALEMIGKLEEELQNATVYEDEYNSSGIQEEDMIKVIYNFCKQIEDISAGNQKEIK